VRFGGPLRSGPRVAARYTVVNTCVGILWAGTAIVATEWLPNYSLQLTSRLLQGPAAQPPRALPRITASRRLQIAPAGGALVAATGAPLSRGALEAPHS
jgi:hypothetical protein